MKRDTRKKGNDGEDTACRFLEDKGCRIIERNFRSRRGEIDIVLDDAGTTVFTEVKYRSGISSGRPYEAVTRSKQITICRTADYYIMKKGLPEEIPYRFDVVSILENDVTWFKNAFEYIPLR